MSTVSTLLAGLVQLSPATNAVTAEIGFKLEMADGISLTTDLYRPQTADRYPTLLIRVPYGRLGFSTIAEIYAERGYNVVLQACRGTDDSEGEFDPLMHERTDGLATLDWIKRQDWFDGRLGTTGPSYLGYAQWAICDALPQKSAMAMKVSTADFENVVFPGGAFALQLWLSWMQTIDGLIDAPLETGLDIITGEVERRTTRAANTLPLIEGDIIATGHPVAFWRRWFKHAVDNPSFWAPLNHRPRIGPDTPPNHFVSGWYDFMLDELLTDYQLMRHAGHIPYLTIGSWFHLSPELQVESVRQTLGWMDAHLKGDFSNLRTKPVRIEIDGDGGWHEFDQYPPPGARPHTLYLGARGKLAPELPDQGEPSSYRYDPADPTPSVGGAMFAYSGAGPRDNTKLEARGDVLTFTSQKLEASLTMIGHVEVTLYVRSDRIHTDFFARLCDVNTHGKSVNVCDKLVRVTPGSHTFDHGGVMRLDITLNAMAHCFRKGHRLRLQISSGAHPRFARNLGTGEPITTATEMMVQNQEVFHDPEHQSRIVLPVYEL